MAQRGSLAWIWQALSGLLLVVLLTLHIIVNHFAAGGLVTYAGIVRYLSNPFILAIEILFLAAVIFHAMAGIRALALDFGISKQTDRSVTWGLSIVGVLMFLYGLWLFTSIV